MERTEIKDLIDETIKDRLPEAFDRKFNDFMSDYGLKPQHWVFLDAQYNKELSNQSLLRKVILTAIVTGVSMATLWGAEDWIKQVVVDSAKHREER